MKDPFFCEKNQERNNNYIININARQYHRWVRAIGIEICILKIFVNRFQNI